MLPAAGNATIRAMSSRCVLIDKESILDISGRYPLPSGGAILDAAKQVDKYIQLSVTEEGKIMARVPRENMVQMYSPCLPKSNDINRLVLNRLNGVRLNGVGPRHLAVMTGLKLKIPP